MGAGVFGVIWSLNSHSPPQSNPKEFLYGPGVHQFGGDGKKSPLSPAYIMTARLICLVLLMQAMDSALSLALLNAGSNMAARIAMIAMTTSNSIKVKADLTVFKELQL